MNERKTEKTNFQEGKKNKQNTSEFYEDIEKFTYISRFKILLLVLLLLLLLLWLLLLLLFGSSFWYGCILWLKCVRLVADDATKFIVVNDVIVVVVPRWSFDCGDCCCCWFGLFLPEPGDIFSASASNELNMFSNSWSVVAFLRNYHLKTRPETIPI